MYKRQNANITNATVGILTLTEVVPTQIIGAGVSIKSGIVTAQGTGIVTFYGDARYLQGMPTSQWEDTNAGLGVSSIYNTGGTVGIATTNPQFALQVGENPNQIGGVSGRGVGISSVGDINASGIITATTFNGALTGNVTGNLTGNVTGNVTGAATRVTLTNQVGDSSCNVLFAQSATGNQLPQTNPNFTFDATNATLTATSFVGNLTGNISGTAGNLSGTPDISVGAVTASSLDISGGVDVDGHTDLDNVSISGVTTFTGATTHSGGATVNTHLDVIGLTTLDDVNVSSGATFAAPIDLNSDLDVDGHTNLDNVSIAGVSTFTGDAILNGDVRVGTAMTFSSNGIVVGNNKDLKIGSGLTIASNTDGSHVTFFNNTEVQHILEPNVTSEVWTSEIQVGGTTVFVPQFKIHRNTGVELYYENGGRKFATSGVGVTISNQLDTTNIDASGVITIDSGAGLSLDAGAASNFTTSSGALTLSGAGGLTLTAPSSQIDIDSSTLTIVTSSSISLDASSAASNFTVDSANLTLSTTTSGTLFLSSANNLELQAQPSQEIIINNADPLLLPPGAAAGGHRGNPRGHRSIL